MTYAITTKASFLELSKAEQKQVIEFLHESIAMDLQVSVQAQTVETSDDDYVTLYGLYANDDEWVSNYNSNGGMWEYSNPAQLLKNFTDGNDADFKFYGISDNLEFEDTPVIFYGSFNHLQPLIDKARQALIDLNADRVQFYYRSEILNGKEIFLNSENLDDVFDIDNDTDISWLAPELAVSIHDTKIVWQDKHDSTNEMWITIERAYGTNFQAIHDRAVNHDSKLA
jgi:hypothetical protein